MGRSLLYSTVHEAEARNVGRRARGEVGRLATELSGSTCNLVDSHRGLGLDGSDDLLTHFWGNKIQLIIAVEHHHVTRTDAAIGT